jgi:hypothetical protein
VSFYITQAGAWIAEYPLAFIVAYVVAGLVAAVLTDFPFDDTRFWGGAFLFVIWPVWLVVSLTLNTSYMIKKFLHRRISAKDAKQRAARDLECNLRRTFGIQVLHRDQEIAQRAVDSKLRELAIEFNNAVAQQEEARKGGLPSVREFTDRKVREHKDVFWTAHNLAMSKGFAMKPRISDYSDLASIPA